MRYSRPIPLPRGWPKIVRSGVLHAISLAATALAAAWSRASTSRSSKRKRRAETDRLRSEVSGPLPRGTYAITATDETGRSKRETVRLEGEPERTVKIRLE